MRGPLFKRLCEYINMDLFLRLDRYVLFLSESHNNISVCSFYGGFSHPYSIIGSIRRGIITSSVCSPIKLPFCFGTHFLLSVKYSGVQCTVKHNDVG